MDAINLLSKFVFLWHRGTFKKYKSFFFIETRFHIDIDTKFCQFLKLNKDIMRYNNIRYICSSGEVYTALDSSTLFV